jgi:hypothetical protein
MSHNPTGLHGLYRVSLPSKWVHICFASCFGTRTRVWTYSIQNGNKRNICKWSVIAEVFSLHNHDCSNPKSTSVTTAIFTLSRFNKLHFDIYGRNWHLCRWSLDGIDTRTQWTSTNQAMELVVHVLTNFLFIPVLSSSLMNAVSSDTWTYEVTGYDICSMYCLVGPRHSSSG